MVLNLWQGFLGKRLQIRICAIRNFILIESGIALLVIDLAPYVIGVEPLAAFMFKG
jgi:hypothetical protein